MADAEHGVRRGATALTARGLVLRFPQGDRVAHVLDNAHVDIHAGELVAVTGPPSCGKTTLIRVLSGELAPDEGTVAHATPGALAVLHQPVDLDDDATIRAHVEAAAGRAGAGAEAAESATSALLEALGLADLGDRLPRKVSRGELQRAALARALVTRPAVLLADEPTGALDARWSINVVEALRHRCADGLAALVTTYEPQVLERADRVLVLTDGRLAS